MSCGFQSRPEGVKTSRQHRSQPAHLLLSQVSERVSVIANRSNRMLIQMRKHLCKQACSPSFHRDRRTAEPYRYPHGQTVKNYFTRARVSLAIASSSFVGITITLTLESGVEITISFPLTLLTSSSILMPR